MLSLLSNSGTWTEIREAEINYSMKNRTNSVRLPDACRMNVNVVEETGDSLFVLKVLKYIYIYIFSCDPAPTGRSDLIII